VFSIYPPDLPREARPPPAVPAFQLGTFSFDSSFLRFFERAVGSCSSTARTAVCPRACHILWASVRQPWHC